MTAAATIFVKHLDRMASFYETGLGFHMVADAPGDYRVLKSAVWTLSVVQVPADVAQAITLSEPPLPRTQTSIKLSFDVPSIAAVRAEITRLGGRVDDREWEFRGFRHCDFVDPEGNVNQLRERVGKKRRTSRAART